MVGFPLLTAGLVLGALWANESWGTYWGFDSKETWALITWLCFLGYLHLRFVGGWRNRRACWFLALGGIVIFITFLLFGYLPANPLAAGGGSDGTSPQPGQRAVAAQAVTNQAPAPGAHVRTDMGHVRSTAFVAARRPERRVVSGGVTLG